jgi:cytoskeleton-associated protein 5
LLPSRLGAPKGRPNFSALSSNAASQNGTAPNGPPSQSNHGHPSTARPDYDDTDTFADGSSAGPDGITITISSILSSDPLRSVDALKKIQKILALKPEDGLSSTQYQELAEHTEGLIETITLQMAHVFDRPDDLVADENFRLAKHLIQTLNNFCDHTFLAESLTVDILTSLLEELTLRLLETDESSITKVKDLSRFINMIILRLFATGRRMSIFR